MLTFEEFKKTLELYSKLNRDFSTLYKMGFDFFEGEFKLEEYSGKIFDMFLDSHFETAGVDWINWFIFENEWGERNWQKYMKQDPDTGELIECEKEHGAYDEHGNPICYSIDSLWEYVKQYLKHEKQEESCDTE